MSNKKLVLILNASQEYIKHTGDEEKKYAPQVNKFFETISDIYIPLLNTFEKLEKNEVPFKVALVLSPVLCTLLEDQVVQEQFLTWIERRIEFGKKEIERCKDFNEILDNVKNDFEKAQNVKDSFLRYNKRIVRKFLEFHKKGFVELLATCATDIFLPHYNDMEEIMNSQIETGYYAYKAFFGEIPEGFWLPYLGYYNGVEKIIRSYKFNYTVLDARSFLFSENSPEKGIFSPARFENSLVAFGKEPFSNDQIFGEDGFANNECYVDVNRDAGYELENEALEPFIKNGEARYSFGYKYWCKNENEEDVIYNSENAKKQAAIDAAWFIENKCELLQKAEKLIPENQDVSITVTVSLNKLASSWLEGIDFIEELFINASKKDVEFVLPKNLLQNQYELQKIHPCYGASLGVGYGESLLASKNSWMMRYAKKASERMVDLSSRFPEDTGLKARLLNLGAKELLMAQSGGWAKMIHENEFPDYAEIRFKQSINDFTQVFDALGSNTVSTEWLTKLENEHQIFPWMNYRIYIKKSN